MSETMNALKMAVETGKSVFGYRQTAKGIKSRAVKLLVISSNAPADQANLLARLAKENGVKVLPFPGTGWDLAALCNRSHVISSLGVMDAGQSNLLDRAG